MTGDITPQQAWNALLSDIAFLARYMHQSLETIEQLSIPEFRTYVETIGGFIRAENGSDDTPDPNGPGTRTVQLPNGPLADTSGLR